MEFTINTDDLKNISGLDNAESVYLYIMEVASAGGNQSTAISNGMKLELAQTTNIEYTSPEGKTTRTSVAEIFGDTTVADKDIPQTGISPVIIVAIGIIFIIGVAVFTRYIKMQRNLRGK
jgi:LPXTG-motif cell wall-anchored protein